MNMLSVLIYLIGLVTKIDIVLFTVCSGCILIAIAAAVAWSEPSSIDNTTFFRIVRKATIIFLISAFTDAVLPSERTMTLIAASEVGERALKTDQAQAVIRDLGGLGSETTDLLRTYIQKQTKSLKDEMNKSGK